MSMVANGSKVGYGPQTRRQTRSSMATLISQVQPRGNTTTEIHDEPTVGEVSFMSLPDEIIAHILDLVSLNAYTRRRSLQAVSLTCRRLRGPAQRALLQRLRVTTPTTAKRVLKVFVEQPGAIRRLELFVPNQVGYIGIDGNISQAPTWAVDLLRKTPGLRELVLNCCGAIPDASFIFKQKELACLALEYSSLTAPEIELDPDSLPMDVQDSHVGVNQGSDTDSKKRPLLELPKLRRLELLFRREEDFPLPAPLFAPSLQELVLEVNAEFDVAASIPTIDHIFIPHANQLRELSIVVRDTEFSWVVLPVLSRCLALERFELSVETSSYMTPFDDGPLETLLGVVTEALSNLSNAPLTHLRYFAPWMHQATAQKNIWRAILPFLQDRRRLPHLKTFGIGWRGSNNGRMVSRFLPFAHEALNMDLLVDCDYDELPDVCEERGIKFECI